MAISFWMKAKDQTKIYIKKWNLEKDKPKAIIQLSHGMAEHIGRYDSFASHFNNEGYIVYGNDHRGHGQTGLKQGRLGYLSNHDGFSKVVEDLYHITRIIKEQYPRTPIILLGHSMGSFIARCYLQKYSAEINGVILSGTGHFSKVQTSVARILASLLPPKTPSKLMNKLTFGNYYKKIPKSKTDFDWLSTDEKVVDEYVNDPLTGFIPSGRFFVDLMTGINQMQNREHTIRKDIPMLFLSGSEDPVGDYEKGVWKSVRFYQELGVDNITTHLFEGVRHELHNEWIKDEVYRIIDHWIMDQLKIYC